jgi:hypothetical protein
MLSILIAMTAALGGCQSTPVATGGSQKRVELLGFADCPNTAEFRQRVEIAASGVGGYAVVYVDQESLPAADLRRGYPAPTALVDGRDLFGMAKPTAPRLGCRMYPGGVPSVAEIADRLRAAALP